MAKLVSKVYGDALFSIAIEENKLEDLWEEVKVIRQAIRENESFLPMLCHPEMSQERRLQILEETFADASDDMKGFFSILVRKGRFGEILKIFDYFDEQAKEYKNIGVVYVSTPLSLKEEQKSQIESKLLQVTKYESLEMHYEVEKELLGGIVIRIGDRILDNSIRAKMETMTRQLNNVKLSG